MAEQRRTGRAQIDILLNKYVGGVPYTARARDISPGGVRLARLLEPEHAGKRVGLQFQLPGSSEVIYAEGEVVRGVGGGGERPDRRRPFHPADRAAPAADPPLRRGCGRRGRGRGVGTTGLCPGVHMSGVPCPSRMAEVRGSTLTRSGRFTSDF